MCQLGHLCCHPDMKRLQRYEKNIYDKIPPPATIIIYDLLII